MPPQIIVKVTYNSELKRISFMNAQTFTYSKLHAEVHAHIHAANNNLTDGRRCSPCGNKLIMFTLSEPYKVYYVDDDMDEVTVTSDQDLAEALGMFQSQQVSSNKGVTCRFSIKQAGTNKGEENPVEKPKENKDEHPGSNAWAGLAQNFVDHLERQMSFMQDSAQSSATALAAAANAAATTATSNWQRTFNHAQSRTAGQSEPTNTGTGSCNTETGFHNNVMCDHCYRAVRGTRWKCQDCRDYDLCDGCKTAGQYNHPTHHQFRSMQSTPSNNHRRHSHYRSRGPFRPHLRNMTVQSASCDFCDSMITGTRYKCKDCPDFDLCERCIVLADTQHPGHTFDMTQNGWRRCPMFQRPPTVNEGSNNNHSGVRCDGCEKWIYGVRYKCGNCPDFDYCSKCEATLEHNPNHIFLKIKKPVDGPVPTNSCLLPNFYAAQKTSPQMQQKQSAQSMGTVFGMFPSAASSSRTVDQQSVGELESKLEKLSTKSEASAVSASVVSTSAQTAEKPSEHSPAASVMSNSHPELFARFVDDVNIPDGTIVAARSRFLKIWNMANEGTQEWPQGTQLIFCGGDTLAPTPNTTTFAVPVTKPGKNVYVTADLQAPAKPGRYVSYFRLVTPSGARFGHRVWCDILVENEEQQGSSTSSSVMIYPILTHREADDEDKATIRTEEGSSRHVSSAFASSVTTPSVRSVSDSEDNDSEAAYSAYDMTIEAEVPGTPDEARDYIVIEQEYDDSHDLADSFHNIRSVSSPDSGKQINPFLTEKEQEDEATSSSKIEELPQETAAPKSTVEPPHAAELEQLHDMGFHNDGMNIALLEAFNYDMENVIMELLRLQQ